jgi:hypothetical protein
MRSVSAAVCATLVAAGAVGSVSMAPRAWASDPAINGIFTVTVIGDWARTREVNHQEAVTRSTWTISTSCTTAQDCAGHVTSDEGWTAPVRMTDGWNFYARRDIPNWEVCPDGTAFPGKDYVYFYTADPETGMNTGDTNAAVLAGREQTVGPSGACGTNLPLSISQPIRLDRIG